MKAHFSSFAYSYCNGNNKSEKSYFLKEHFSAIKSLRNNRNIVISKSDKGGGCVILDKSDYVSKMASILDDTTKFMKLGPVEKNDTTKKREKEFCTFIKGLENDGLLPENIAALIKPTGSTRPRLYGLPKTHKENVPLRPVLSTVGCFQQPLAKFLKEVLQPVYKKYSKYCIPDSFSFANLIKEHKCENIPYLCSFDVKSLFTCIPVDEIILICTQSLYEDPDIVPPEFDRNVFEQLMEYALCNIEFSFNDNMYRQINGLGMGNILSSILANIFVGYYEIPCINSCTSTSRPLMYKRYVDDCFAMFDDKRDAQEFLGKLNQLNPALEFTVEHEENQTLPFLDVNVHKERNGAFSTSIYRKPTFAGQYQHWNSFCPIQRKLNLIDLLIHRAINICSKLHIESELSNIRRILSENGYPIHIINQRIKRKLQLSAKNPIYGPKKCAVYLHLPYLGEHSEQIAKAIRSCAEKVFFSVSFRTVFSTKKILPKCRKDVLPSQSVSNVVYQFSCKHCDSVYVGRTSRRLDDRIREHVPRALIKLYTSPPTPVSVTNNESAYNLRTKRTNALSCVIPKYLDSAVGQHLAENPDCGRKYNDDCFSVIGKARSAYHLKVLEAVTINRLKPDLCRQKQFVYHTVLFPNFI